MKFEKLSIRAQSINRAKPEGKALRKRDHLVFFASLFFCTLVSVIFLEWLSTRYRPGPAPGAEMATNQPTASSAATPSVPKAEKYLLAEAALLGTTDNASYYFKDLAGSGDETSLAPTRSWIPASTIKAYVAVEAFRQARLGLINFDQNVTISAQNVVSTELETDEFPRLRDGSTVTIRQLVEAMIVESNNVAYNTLLDILDRRSINNTLHELGLTESVAGQKLNLDDSQGAVDVNVPGYQPNTTTAKDFATFFDLLYSHQIPGAENILAIFKRQKINNMIPALLPENIPVAHKTGDWAPIYHDGGIVYKPQDPFILTIFTNSGNPNILANLARVAYLRNAQAVGVLPAPQLTVSQNNFPMFYLAQAETTKVLAANTTAEDKFPTITAADLGISQADLTIDAADATKINPAIVTPNSLFYGLKRAWEDLQYNLATTPDQKTNVMLSQALTRLSEARTLYGQNQPSLASAVISESQTDLSAAASLAKNSPSPDFLLAKTKQVNDLQFATLAKVTNINPTAAEQFVNTVYHLYQKNQETVAPAVKSSPISNPTGQIPAIVTVTKIEAGKITIESDSGQTKELLVSDFTPVRQFQSKNIGGPDQVEVGQKIAVIGQTGKDGKVIPQFILNNLPPQLPSHIRGTVLEINPATNSLKIEDHSGRQFEVVATSETLTRSSQTGISIPGIRAGSVVTVSTNQLPATASATGEGTPGNTGPTPSGPNNKHSSPTTTKNQNNNPPPVVKATTITITKNGSGKGEKTSQKPSPPKPATQPKTNSKKSSALPPESVFWESAA